MNRRTFLLGTSALAVLPVLPAPSREVQIRNGNFGGLWPRGAIRLQDTEFATNIRYWPRRLTNDELAVLTTADALSGQPKPVAYGRLDCGPPEINSDKLLYQGHDGPVLSAAIYSEHPDWSFTLGGRVAEKVDAVDIGGGFFRVTATA